MLEKLPITDGLNSNKLSINKDGEKMKNLHQTNKKLLAEKLKEILDESYRFCRHQDGEVSSFSAKINDKAYHCLKILGEN